MFNQKQYVTINGSNSSIKKNKNKNKKKKTIATGVPQESVSRSLLFLVHINDLCKSVKYSESYHFTDDTNMLQSHSL